MNELMNRYLANPAFAPSLIAKISKAAFGLCSWVGAIEAYDRAAKIVAPKVAALRAAEAEYNEVMAQLAIKQANLKVVCISTLSNHFMSPLKFICNFSYHLSGLLH